MYPPNINITYNCATTPYNQEFQPTAPMEYLIPPQHQSSIPQYQVTQSIHNDTCKLLSTMSRMSADILYGKDQNSHSHLSFATQQPILSKVSSILLVDNSWKMFSRGDTHVHHHYHRENDKKDETGTRILVGFIGLVIAAVTAVFIGKAIAQGEDIKEDKVNFQELKTHWNFYRVYYEVDYQSLVASIICKADILEQRQQTHRVQKMTLLALGFFGGGIAVGGAIIGSTPLMLTAAAIESVVIVMALFKLGYNCFSTHDRKVAQSIENELHLLMTKRVIVI